MNSSGIDNPAAYGDKDDRKYVFGFIFHFYTNELWMIIVNTAQDALFILYILLRN